MAQNFIFHILIFARENKKRKIFLPFQSLSPKMSELTKVGGSLRNGFWAVKWQLVDGGGYLSWDRLESTAHNCLLTKPIESCKLFIFFFVYFVINDWRGMWKLGFLFFCQINRQTNIGHPIVACTAPDIVNNLEMCYFLFSFLEILENTNTLPVNTFTHLLY